MRNLANLFFGEALRNTLDRIVTETRLAPKPAAANPRPELQCGASQTPGGKNPAPDQKPALADDAIAVNLSAAEKIIGSQLRRYRDARGLQATRPADLEFQSRFVQAKIAECGLVALPADEVHALLRELHEPGHRLWDAFPALAALQDDLARYEEHHPFGFKMPFRSVKMVMCRLSKWAEQLALMKLALKSHIGLLVTIRFQLALRDRSEAARNNLLQLLKSMEQDFTELAAVRKSLEVISSPGALMDGVEKAYAQFRAWFETVLKPGDDSRRYLPPELAQMRYPKPPAIAVAAPSAELDAPAAARAQARPTPLSEPAVLTELADGDLPEPAPVPRTMSMTGPAAAPESAAGPQPSIAPEAGSVPGFRSASARVAPDAIIGNRVTIRAGAIVESRAFVGDDVTIGAEAFIGTRAIVEKGAKIGTKVKVPAFTRVAPGAVITSLDLRGNVHLAQGTVFCGDVVCRANVYLKQACRLGAGVEIASNMTIWDAVNFSDGARVDVWNVPKGTRGLTAGGSLYVRGEAQVGPNVTVGANVVIDEDAVIEAGASIGSHVKVGYGKTVGAGARIADELEIIADVPPGTVIGTDGTAPDGERYAHMISPFTISKIGVVKMTPAPTRTTSGPVPPVLPASDATASEAAGHVAEATAAMETETLLLRPSNMSSRSRTSVARVTQPPRSRTATGVDPRPGDSRIPTSERPVIDVKSLPSVRSKTATNKLKRAAGEPEAGQEPSQKRPRPEALSLPPNAQQTQRGLPAKSKTSAQAPAPKELPPSRVELLLGCVDLPSESRATVSVPPKPPASSTPAPRPAQFTQTVKRPQNLPKPGS